MSMISCPGCGLPRVEDQADTVCPVCAAGPAAPGPRPELAETHAPDPTTGLPADVGELQRYAAGDTGLPRWFLWVAVFLLGTAVGTAGTLGWRTAFPPAEVADTDATPPDDVAPAQAPPPPVLPVPPAPSARVVHVAPMPHEPAPPSPPPELAIAPAPRAATGPPPPPRIVTLDLFMPDVAYVLPSDLRKAPRVILRGKVKALKVISLDNGQVLDASGLTAETVSVSGRVGNGSVLKVNAPGGIVNINEGISGKSLVEINAPGGEVRFTRETRPGRPGSEIDGGSMVTITARRVDLRGDVNGIETRVTVNLTDDGWLWAEAVRGIATVEYRTANGPGKPSASAGVVTPTATFRQIK